MRSSCGFIHVGITFLYRPMFAFNCCEYNVACDFSHANVNGYVTCGYMRMKILVWEPTHLLVNIDTIQCFRCKNYQIWKKTNQVYLYTSYQWFIQMCSRDIRGFAKLKKFQKSKNNLDRAQPTHPPTPLSKYFFFLETHQWHGQNTQITTFNNVQTEYITLRSYHMSTHSPHWK